MSLLINCHSISKSFGSRTLFQELSFGIFEGDRIGMIGPNGSGKSTLLKMLAKQEKPDDGTISSKRHLRVGYVPQDSILPNKPLMEILLNSFPDEDHSDPHLRETNVLILLSKLGFEDPEQNAQALSGGWKKRLDIAKELLKEPDLLLLDEPTNHLDLEGILWLEKFMKEQTCAYLIISHDRYFLEHITTRMMELNRSYPNGMLAIEGNYSNFLEKREEFLEGQVQYQKSLASKTRREEEWLLQNPKARTTKSRSRIQEAGRLIQELADVKSRNTQSVTTIDFSSSDRQSRKLIAVKNLAKTMGDKTLFSGVDFVLSPGTRLGLVGPNGSGKTTLFKLLAGELTADVGTIKYADDVRIVYFDQHRMKLPQDLSLRKALAKDSDTVNYRGQSIHVNSWCKRFLFSPDRLDLPLSKFSGGEKARVMIARLMLQPADVLLLDEPTNDLDIPTLEILEASLLEFPGAVVLITHDRYMLDQIANVVLGLGPTSDGSLYADYAQWEEAQKNRLKALSKALSAKPAPPAEKKKVESSAVAAPAAPVSVPKKLTFKDKYELEHMEENIHKLEKELELYHQKLADTAFSSDPVKVQEIYEKLNKAQAQVDLLYKRWQELEALS